MNDAPAVDALPVDGAVIGAGVVGAAVAASWLPSVRPADGPVTLTLEVR